jgi:hypothetical protein
MRQDEPHLESRAPSTAVTQAMVSIDPIILYLGLKPGEEADQSDHGFDVRVDTDLHREPRALPADSDVRF